MVNIGMVVDQLSEETIASRIDDHHRRVRRSFPYQGNRVRGWLDFQHWLGEYYGYHHSACISRGGNLSPVEAAERAKLLIHGSRMFGGIRNAYTAASTGKRGGLQGVFDELCEQLISEATENYINHTLDHYVTPISFAEKKEFVRALQREYGGILDSSLRECDIDEYAHDFKRLVRIIMQSREHLSHEIRRER